MFTRRQLLVRATQLGFAAATRSLWSHSVSTRAFAQAPLSTYRAIVIVSMPGGNDGNNMVVPTSGTEYSEYARIRGTLALPLGDLNQLSSTSGTATYGLHPSLQRVAGLYNQGRAAIVANVGPLSAPVSKAALLAGQSGYPDSLFSHPDGLRQWESASAYNGSPTGWGGRIADLLISQSGSLPPVLNGSVQSLFTVGRSIQAVAVQGGGAFPALPGNLQTAIDAIAANDSQSSNLLIKQAAAVRRASLAQQAILTRATAYKPLRTSFPATGFGSVMRTVARVIAGNEIVGASRQIFYTQQGSYDSHAGQLGQHANNLSELDGGLGAFFEALDELGMSNQVLVCTHSDFNRTFAPNGSAGSDHAWGNHQLILGGGIAGGRVLGQMPALDLNGSADLNGLGIWIPTTAVVQLTAGIGSWLGLSAEQLMSVFPELKNFPAGALALS